MGAEEEFVFWNGELSPVGEVKVSPSAEGLLYGFGCFETMGLSNGRIRFLSDHWDRISRAAADMELECPDLRERLLDQVSQLCKYNHCEEGIVRLSLHKNGRSTDVLLRVFARTPSADESSFEVDLSRFPHSGPSPLSGWKHNNYLLNALAYREAVEMGLRESILCRDGKLVEGSRSNVWVLREGVLWTPPVESGALPGVVRKRVLSSAAEMRVDVREGAILAEDLEDCDGLFFSNAGMLFKAATRCSVHEFSPHLELVNRVNEVLLR